MKKIKIIDFLLLVAIVHCNLCVQGQNKFKAGIAAGATLSQVDGDLQHGYHKLGYALGLNGAYFLKPNMDISTELYLITRGTKPSSKDNIPRKDQWQTSLSMQYAEARLVSNWHFSPHPDKYYYRYSLHAGLIFGRLLSSNLNIVKGYRTDTLVTDAVRSGLKSNDLGLTVAWSWHFSPRLSFMLQQGVSLIPIYKNTVVQVATIRTEKKGFDRYVPYYISAQMRYDFISPKLNTRNIKKKKKLKVRDNPLEQIE